MPQCIHKAIPALPPRSNVSTHIITSQHARQAQKEKASLGARHVKGLRVDDISEHSEHARWGARGLRVRTSQSSQCSHPCILHGVS